MTDPLDGASVFALLDDLRAFLAENVNVNGSPLGSAVTTDPGSILDGVAVIITPPLFEYDGQGCAEPSGATVQIFVLVPNDSGMIANLMSMALGVAHAIDAGTSHTVLSSSPGTWVSSPGRMNPAYSIDVSLDLSDT